MSGTSGRSKEGNPSVCVLRNKGGVEIVNRMVLLQLNDTSTPHKKSPLAKEDNDTTEEGSKGKSEKLEKSVSLHVRLQ
jgi:hypothetical protein